MNLDLCKACPFCDRYPSAGQPAAPSNRVHYQCQKAHETARQNQNHFTSENPTPLIAEEYDERVRIKAGPGGLVVQHVIAVKAKFKVPASCPVKAQHG